MTDSDLEGKFTRLADGVLPADRIRRLMDLCWKVDTLKDAAELAQAVRV